MIVITTCSPHNNELVKVRGADYVIDYRAPDAVESIHELTESNLQYVFDCVGDGLAPKFCYDAFGVHGGRYSSVLFPPTPERNDISVGMAVAYTSYGSAFDKFGRHWPAQPDAYKYGAEFFKIAEQLLVEGKLICHPVQLQEGGLLGTIKGLEDLKSGNISGKKLVYSL